jgi:hypothetical protein
MSIFIMDKEKEIETDAADRVICANIANHHDLDRSGNENRG